MVHVATDSQYSDRQQQIMVRACEQKENAFPIMQHCRIDARRELTFPPMEARASSNNASIEIEGATGDGSQGENRSIASNLYIADEGNGDNVSYGKDTDEVSQWTLSGTGERNDSTSLRTGEEGVRKSISDEGASAMVKEKGTKEREL